MTLADIRDLCWSIEGSMREVLRQIEYKNGRRSRVLCYDVLLRQHVVSQEQGKHLTLEVTYQGHRAELVFEPNWGNVTLRFDGARLFGSDDDDEGEYTRDALNALWEKLAGFRCHLAKEAARRHQGFRPNNGRVPEGSPMTVFMAF
jgi:hypothetical protein